MSTRTTSPFLLAALACATGAAAAPAGAQGAAPRPIELGIDGGLSVSLDDPRVTVLQIPGQRLRAGFFLSARASVEPSVSLVYARVSDETDEGEDFSFSQTVFNGDLGVVLHFTPDARRAQGYVRPFAGLQYGRGGGESATQFRLGGGIGVKTPIVERLALRLEGNLTHALDDDDEFEGGTAIGLTFGLSFFTR